MHALANRILAEPQPIMAIPNIVHTSGYCSVPENFIERFTSDESEIDIDFSCRPSSEEMIKNQKQLRGPK
jgi:hypothetical protein